MPLTVTQTHALGGHQDAARRRCPLCTPEKLREAAARWGGFALTAIRNGDDPFADHYAKIAAGFALAAMKKEGTP